MNNIPIFIVNLKKDSEKKEHMKKLCKQYALDCQFTDAVDGKKLDQNELSEVYDSKRAQKEYGRKLSPGEIGCTLSHKEIYRKMVNEQIAQALIFEDDITFDDRIHDALSSISNFPIDWECVLLHYHRNNPFAKRYCISLYDRQAVGKGLKIVRFTELMHSTGAYIINLAGAKKLFANLEEGMYKPIDHYTGDEHDVNLYGLHPRIVETDAKIHLQSAILTERNIARKSALEQAEKTDGKESSIEKFRKMLKRIGLHTLFKKINTKRLDMLFYVKNFKMCLTKPEKYR